jgi:hypothetical protein
MPAPTGLRVSDTIRRRRSSANRRRDRSYVVQLLGTGLTDESHLCFLLYLTVLNSLFLLCP